MAKRQPAGDVRLDSGARWTWVLGQTSSDISRARSVPAQHRRWGGEGGLKKNVDTGNWDSIMESTLRWRDAIFFILYTQNELL